MKAKIKKYSKEFFFMAIILFVVSTAMSFYKAQDLNKAPLSLQQFTLLDNSIYTVQTNKPIMLHFWATWCPTCQFESSNIHHLAKKYEVVTIAVQSGNNGLIENYMKKHDLNFNVVNDDEGVLAKQFNIKAFPTTLIYDGKHTLRFSEVGYTSTFGLYARMLLAL